jgi:hypothetical protein
MEFVTNLPQFAFHQIPKYKNDDHIFYCVCEHSLRLAFQQNIKWCVIYTFMFCKKAKFALRAKITASQESSWKGKHQPSTQNKQTKK